MTYFLTVAQQVLVLFVLIGAGFVITKTGLLTDKGAKVCSDIALFLGTPCAIINSFNRSANREQWIGLALALGASLLIHGVGIGAAQLLYRKNTERNAVFRLTTVLSNSGFMGLPLQQAILGDDGVFYGAAYVVMFNLVLWSYGVLTMDKSGTRPSVRKMLITPGSMGLLLGVLVMLLPVSLPEVLATPVKHLGNLNTPLPMLFIGYSLAQVDFKAILRRGDCLLASVVRLVLVPVLGVALLYLLGLRGELLIAMSIASCAPVAAATAMFASRYDRDSETAVSMVSLSTVLSLVTMPLLVTLTQLLP